MAQSAIVSQILRCQPNLASHFELYIDNSPISLLTVGGIQAVCRLPFASSFAGLRPAPQRVGIKTPSALPLSFLSLALWTMTHCRLRD